MEIEWLRIGSTEVAFDSPQEELAYAKQDEELARRIEGVVRESKPSSPPEQLVYTSLDWYPNRCRSVTLSKPALSAQLLLKLQSLLCAEFKDWRIFANVVESFDSPQMEVGNVFLLHDRAVVQSSVQEVLDRVA